MRLLLDRLYRTSAFLAAGSLVLILLVVLIQVIFNLIDRLLQWVGTAPIGLLIPSYAEIAGYLLAAATFLALAGSFRAGSHIRVNLFLRRLPERVRRPLETLVLLLALGAAGYFAWFTGHLTWGSIRFGDVSPGLLPIPLWLPQSAMTLGLGILVIALADELAAALAGRQPAYRQAEAAAQDAADQARGEL